jgi:SPP1 gp7 family putative phage head morphogenesis protein
MKLPRGVKVLKAVHPNAGIGADYRGKLDRLIARMQRSYVYFLKAQYRATPPRMAMDETPAQELERELRRLGIRWQEEFTKLAPKMARWFSQSVERRSALAMQKMLKDAGMTVRYTMTPAMRDVFRATVEENVALIRSIGQQYHTEVVGLVMRSVQQGRDLGTLTKALEDRYGITRRRAALIARDQNNKATAVMTRVRQTEAGIKQAVWLHSLGGKEPRKTHLANNGKVYDIDKGWFDPDPRVRRRIWPGELINCRCVCKPIVKGFS